MFSLKDRVALVTGASQGIGRATALALAAAGARVVAAARNAEKLAGVVQEIAAAGGEALAVQMDVADAEQVKAGFRQGLERFGRLDILVNNAAITRDGLAVRMKAEDWDAVLRTNLTGAHLCIQQALAVMLRQRSRPDHQRDLGGRRNRQRRPGQLRRRQGRPDRPDARDRRRSGLAEHHRQRRGAGLHRFADDRSAAAER